MPTSTTLPLQQPTQPLRAPLVPSLPAATTNTDTPRTQEQGHAFSSTTPALHSRGTPAQQSLPTAARTVLSLTPGTALGTFTTARTSSCTSRTHPPHAQPMPQTLPPLTVATGGTTSKSNREPTPPQPCFALQKDTSRAAQTSSYTLSAITTSTRQHTSLHTTQTVAPTPMCTPSFPGTHTPSLQAQAQAALRRRSLITRRRHRKAQQQQQQQKELAIELNCPLGLPPLTCAPLALPPLPSLSQFTFTGSSEPPSTLTTPSPHSTPETIMSTTPSHQNHIDDGVRSWLHLLSPEEQHVLLLGESTQSSASAVPLTISIQHTRLAPLQLPLPDPLFPFPSLPTTRALSTPSPSTASGPSRSNSLPELPPAPMRATPTGSMFDATPTPPPTGLYNTPYLGLTSSTSSKLYDSSPALPCSRSSGLSYPGKDSIA